MLKVISVNSWMGRNLEENIDKDYNKIIIKVIIQYNEDFQIKRCNKLYGGQRQKKIWLERYNEVIEE